MQAKELVKMWNEAKGVRHSVGSDEAPSELVCKVGRYISQYGEEAVQDWVLHKIKTGSEKYMDKCFSNWNPEFQEWLKGWKAEHEAKAAEAVPVQGANVLGDLASAITTLIGQQLVEQSKARIEQALKDYVSDKVISKVVQISDLPPVRIDGVTHEKFNDILQLLALNIPVMLVGPAGSGKNVLVEQLAKALGLEFYFTNAVTQEYALTGFVDAMGNYQETPFYKWAKNGGLFFFDEIDASIPEALLKVNSAIANGYADFPQVGRVILNEKCRIVAAANTYGTGATMEYVGRSQLDAASLNRFAMVPVAYDARIEEHEAGGNQDILRFAREFRKACERNGVQVVVSYRDIKRLSLTIDGAHMKVADALRYCMVKGLEPDTIRAVASSMPDDVKFKKDFLSLAR